MGKLKRKVGILMVIPGYVAISHIFTNSHTKMPRKGDRLIASLTISQLIGAPIQLSQ